MTTKNPRIVLPCQEVNKSTKNKDGSIEEEQINSQDIIYQNGYGEAVELMSGAIGFRLGEISYDDLLPKITYDFNPPLKFTDLSSGATAPNNQIFVKLVKWELKHYAL